MTATTAVLDQRIAAGTAFISRCADGADIHALIGQYEQLIGDFGFEVAAGGCWVGVGKERRHRFFFNNWPLDWLEFYNSQGFFDKDFFVEESRRRIRPFLLSEMDADRLARDPAAELVRLCAERGWIECFGVPIRGPGGLEGVVAITGRRILKLDTAERIVLEAMSRTLHERCRLATGLGAPPPADPPLTEREIECMKWVATGKSDWQIGALAGISGATVHFHVEQTKKKLGVRSRVQAVAILILHGLI